MHPAVNFKSLMSHCITFMTSRIIRMCPSSLFLLNFCSVKDQTPNKCSSAFFLFADLPKKLNRTEGTVIFAMYFRADKQRNRTESRNLSFIHTFPRHFFTTFSYLSSIWSISFLQGLLKSFKSFDCYSWGQRTNASLVIAK